MPLVLRGGLGRELVEAEMDGNFTYLDGEKTNKLESVALSLNVPKENVMYGTVGASIATNITHIYVAGQQTTYGKPDDVPDGAVIVSVVDDVLEV